MSDQNQEDADPIRTLIARIEANSVAITLLAIHLSKSHPDIRDDVASEMDDLADRVAGKDAITERADALRRMAGWLRNGW